MDNKIKGVVILSIDFMGYLEAPLLNIVTACLETVLVSYDICSDNLQPLLNELCWKASRDPQAIVNLGDININHDLDGIYESLYKQGSGILDWLLHENATEFYNIYETMNVVDAICIGATNYKASFLIQGE